MCWREGLHNGVILFMPEVLPAGVPLWANAHARVTVLAHVVHASNCVRYFLCMQLQTHTLVHMCDRGGRA